MARRRYYRRSIRTVPKRKWASNIVQKIVTTSNYQTICENAYQNNSPTPVIVKTGNFRLQGEVSVTYNNPTALGEAGVFLYIIFCPEGVTPSDGLITTHPEYVIGWTAVDCGLVTPGTSGVSPGNKVSLTSRLKRNLNSGDKIVLILMSATSGVTASCTCVTQFYTCAN